MPRFIRRLAPYALAAALAAAPGAAQQPKDLSRQMTPKEIAAAVSYVEKSWDNYDLVDNFRCLRAADLDRNGSEEYIMALRSKRPRTHIGKMDFFVMPIVKMEEGKINQVSDDFFSDTCENIEVLDLGNDQTLGYEVVARAGKDIKIFSYFGDSRDTVIGCYQILPNRETCDVQFSDDNADGIYEATTTTRFPEKPIVIEGVLHAFPVVVTGRMGTAFTKRFRKGVLQEEPESVAACTFKEVVFAREVKLNSYRDDYHFIPKKSGVTLKCWLGIPFGVPFEVINPEREIWLMGIQPRLKEDPDCEGTYKTTGMIRKAGKMGDITSLQFAKQDGTCPFDILELL